MYLMLVNDRKKKPPGLAGGFLGFWLRAYFPSPAGCVGKPKKKKRK